MYRRAVIVGVVFVALLAACAPQPPAKGGRNLQELFIDDRVEYPGATNVGGSYGSPAWTGDQIDPDEYPDGSGLVLDIHVNGSFSHDDDQGGYGGSTLPVCVEVLFKSASGVEPGAEYCRDIPPHREYDPMGSPLGSHGYDGHLELGPVPLPSEPIQIAVRVRAVYDNAVCESRPYGFCGGNVRTDFGGLTRVRWPEDSNLSQFPEIAALTSVNLPYLNGHFVWPDEARTHFIPLPPRQDIRYYLDASHYPEGAEISAATSVPHLPSTSSSSARDACVRLVASTASATSSILYNCVTLTVTDAGWERFFSNDHVELGPMALSYGAHSYASQLDPVDWSDLYQYDWQGTGGAQRVKVSW